ncbi:DMT family transporter [Alkaliflexus imshenetskii]|uniref:DMT family transporter n=1 Tax=Alkaliflexus imshenetskii TaxID=286730 RepID=UPI0005C7A46E|nr:DMT family transporter [Alkaliflexus imshenetskii]
MEQYKKHLIHLHIIVFIYGFTAILGRLITLDAISLVWYRMLIAFVTLGLMLLGLKKRIDVSPKSLMVMVGIGFIVAFHWITFFHAIKISTISVALGCLASTTLFTSFLEPAIIRRRISFLEVLTGVVIIIGLYIIFQFEPDHFLGILIALLSAFLAALFTVLNKALVKKHHPVTISFYEMGGGFLAITLFMLVSGSFNAYFPIPKENDLIYLLLLGIVCTSYAFMASVKVMKSLSAYTVVLTVNLEPVYGILMAFFMFGDTEKMSPGFYLGTLIVLSAVFLFPVLRKKFPTRG